jgi:hypothetical protein
MVRPEQEQEQEGDGDAESPGSKVRLDFVVGSNEGRGASLTLSVTFLPRVCSARIQNEVPPRSPSRQPRLHFPLARPRSRLSSSLSPSKITSFSSLSNYKLAGPRPLTTTKKTTTLTSTLAATTVKATMTKDVPVRTIAAVGRAISRLNGRWIVEEEKQEEKRGRQRRRRRRRRYSTRSPQKTSREGSGIWMARRGNPGLRPRRSWLRWPSWSRLVLRDRGFFFRFRTVVMMGWCCVAVRGTIAWDQSRSLCQRAPTDVSALIISMVLFSKSLSLSRRLPSWPRHLTSFVLKGEAGEAGTRGSLPRYRGELTSAWRLSRDYVAPTPALEGPPLCPL